MKTNGNHDHLLAVFSTPASLSESKESLIAKGAAIYKRLDAPKDNVFWNNPKSEAAFKTTVMKLLSDAKEEVKY